MLTLLSRVDSGEPPEPGWANTAAGDRSILVVWEAPVVGDAAGVCSIA